MQRYWLFKVLIVLLASSPVISNAQDIWMEDFVGVPGIQPSQWLDKTEGVGDAQIVYSYDSSYVYVSQTVDHSYGGWVLLDRYLEIDTSIYDTFEFSIDQVSDNCYWSVFLQEESRPNWNIQVHKNTTGKFTKKLSTVPGHAGLQRFRIRLRIEGPVGSTFVMNYIKFYSVDDQQPTSTPTPYPDHIFLWEDDFEGVSGEQPATWLDETQDGNSNCEVEYAETYSNVKIRKRDASQWGKILSPLLCVDPVEFPMLEFQVSGLCCDTTWVLAIWDVETDTYKKIIESQDSTGKFTINYPSEMGWGSGEKRFRLEFALEGHINSYMFIDTIRIYSSNPPTPTPTPSHLCKEFWRDDFTGPVGRQAYGWIDTSEMTALGGDIVFAASGKAANLSKTVQDTYVMSPLLKVDTSEYPIAEIKINSPKYTEGAWGLAIQEEEESSFNYYELIPESHSSGTYCINYADITGWSSGTHKFRLQLMAKDVDDLEVDYVCIRSNTAVTATPTMTPTPAIQYLWSTSFEGDSGEQVYLWEDATQFGQHNAEVSYASITSNARVARTQDNIWGKVLTPKFHANVDAYPYVKIHVSQVGIGPTWKVGVLELEGEFNYIDLCESQSVTGEYVFDIREATGWSGEKDFAVQFSVEGAEDEYVELESLSIYGYPIENTPIVTPTAVPLMQQMIALRSRINPKHGEYTIIRWPQQAAAYTTIKIFNLAGEHIKTLVNDQRFSMGNQEVIWDGKNGNDTIVGSGIYLVHIKSGKYQDYVKVAVIQ